MDVPAVAYTAELGPLFVARLNERWPALPLAGAIDEAIGSLDDGHRSAIQVLVVRGSKPLRSIGSLPRLRLLCCVGSGYEAIDIAAARALGIAVTHSPGANAASVADLAIGLMLAVMRGIVVSNELLRQGVWPGAHGAPRRRWRSPTGRNAGIYGLGEIGSRIATRAEALEMNVGYHSRTPRERVRWPYHRSLVELARWADVLFIAARAAKTNRAAVDRAVLEALGRNGYLVNIARGSIVDETALVAALTSGTIAGAALDVFANEPHVPPALVALPNVVATPHVAGDTTHGDERMADMVIANIGALFDGRPLPNLVEGSYEPPASR